MGAFDLAGTLKVAIEVRGGFVRDVHIDSTRPQLANRLLAGKPAAAAVAAVPQLFSLCGRSQHIAAELALAAARGAAAAADAQQVRRIETETAHEYLWRALIDWTRADGRTADDKTLAAARSALANDDRALLREIVERDVLGADARRWYEDGPDFDRWVAGGSTAAARLLAAVRRDGPRQGACAVQLLPRFDVGDTVQRIAATLEADADFERRPHYEGGTAETGAVARLREQPLVAALSAAFGRSTLVRLAARLVELARIACDRAAPAPLAGSVRIGAGRGLGWVETARGLLLHRIDLNGDRIGRYRIVAPTEWNFHPDGALKQALLGAHAPDESALERRAHWMLQALDPCVAYTLQVEHA